MSTIKCTTIQNLAGVEVYTAKAWVNFNGTGAVAIRASGNVTSISDNGVGDYSVNFTPGLGLTDGNYSTMVQQGRGLSSLNSFAIAPMFNQQTALSFRLGTFNSSFAATDSEYVNVAIFR
jgi:hypothetical protein